jgi:hypothetical protein
MEKVPIHAMKFSFGNKANLKVETPVSCKFSSRISRRMFKLSTNLFNFTSLSIQHSNSNYFLLCFQRRISLCKCKTFIGVPGMHAEQWSTFPASAVISVSFT